MEGLKEGSLVAPGSLPHTETSAAIRFQRAAFPGIPAWPQLPRLSPRDRTGFQELAGMPVLTWPHPDEPVLHTDHPGFGEVVELLRSENRTGPFDRGAFAFDDAPGFYGFLREAGSILGPETLAVKGQCAGPVTLGLCVKDGYGKPLLASREGMEAMREYLLLHARWQVSRLASLGWPVVFTFDEPALGSTFEPDRFGWSWKEVTGWFDELSGHLQNLGVVTGLHCCGPGPWPWVPDTALELFHFDARYLPGLLDDPPGWERFLRQGGALIFGVVPTHPGASLPAVGRMLESWREFADQGASRGIDRERLAGRSLFSTACGLGAAGMTGAENAALRLREFAENWIREWAA